MISPAVTQRSVRARCPPSSQERAQNLDQVVAQLSYVLRASLALSLALSLVGKALLLGSETQKVLTALRKDLNLAIQREEYERAAELRDKIKSLESKTPDA